MLKLRKWDNVIKHCSEVSTPKGLHFLIFLRQVLLYDKNNTKALYRRGVAYMETGQLDESESDLKKALQLDPTG